MSQIYIMAFVGSGNLGDEAILAGTLLGLKQAGAPLPTVFSWNRAETASQYGVAALPVVAGWRGVAAFASSLRRGDLLILGGGSLLQDGQRRIVPFWLSRALAAKAKGCTVVYHAQGVGPLNTQLGRLLVRAIVPLTADAYTVRDRTSQELLAPVVKAELVADPALLLPPVAVTKKARRVVVALRRTSRDQALSQLAQSLRALATEAEVEYIYLPMHRPDDAEISEQMAALTAGQVYTGPHTVSAVRELLASAELVVAMRLHAAILALGVGTPSVGLSYDPKVQAFFTEAGLAEYVLPWSSELSPGACTSVLTSAYGSRLELVQQVTEQVGVLRLRAKKSIDVALARWRE